MFAVSSDQGRSSTSVDQNRLPRIRPLNTRFRSKKKRFRHRKIRRNSRLVNSNGLPYRAIFQNTRFFVHMEDRSARRKVIKGLVRKFGGSVAHSMGASVDYILVEDQATAGKLCQHFRWDLVPMAVPIILASWVSASIKVGYTLNVNDYLVMSPQIYFRGQGEVSGLFVNDVHGRPISIERLEALQNAASVSNSSGLQTPVFNDHDTARFYGNNFTSVTSETDSSKACTISFNDNDESETTRYESVSEEGSTYDDGIYNEETSCDDEWLYTFKTPKYPKVKLPEDEEEELYMLGSPLISNIFEESNSDSSESINNYSQPDEAMNDLKSTVLSLDAVGPSAELRHIRVGSEPALSPARASMFDSPFASQTHFNLERKYHSNFTRDVQCSPAKKFIKPASEPLTLGEILEKKISLAASSMSNDPFRREVKPFFAVEDISIFHRVNPVDTLAHNLSQESSVSDCKSRSISKSDSCIGLFHHEMFMKENVEQSKINELTVLPAFGQLSLDKDVEQTIAKMIDFVSAVSQDKEISDISISKYLHFQIENIKESFQDCLKSPNEDSQGKKQNLKRSITASMESYDVNECKRNCYEDDMDSTNILDRDKNRVSLTQEISNDESAWEEKNSKSNFEFDFKVADDNAMGFGSTISLNESLSVTDNVQKTTFESTRFTPENMTLTSSEQTSDIFKEFPSHHFCNLGESTVSGNQPYPVHLFKSCNGTSFEEKIPLYNNSLKRQDEYILPKIFIPSFQDSFDVSFEPVDANASMSNLKYAQKEESSTTPDVPNDDLFFPLPPKKKTVTSKDKPFQFGLYNHKTIRSYLDHDCPNKSIITKLMVLLRWFRKVNDRWRIHVYEKAITVLGKYHKSVESLSGFNSIHDLHKESNLSRAHKVGLRYYEDLKTKMSKTEAQRISYIVCRAVFQCTTNVHCDACTLRRERKTYGHVSVLLTLPKSKKNDHSLLPDVVSRLHQEGYLIDDLIRHEENGLQTKYSGIIQVDTKSKCRRVEITVCPQEEHACAKLFLTGSSCFNKSIQQIALKKDMILDKHSLQLKVLSVKEETDYAISVQTNDEKNIFQYLKLPYRSPTQRKGPYN